MKRIYLSLGSNLVQRALHLEEAKKQIQSRIGRLEKVSGYYESEPWGYSSAYRFYNCCISLRTNMDPLPLLELLLDIEREMGRHRAGTGYSDRIIDIDLLLYANHKLDHPKLTLPHPSMGDRRFVLAPLAEIAPELIHPVTGLTITEMLRVCADQSEVSPVP